MIIVLGLLWCNVSFADCRDDLDYEVTAEDAGGEKLFYVIYIIKNNSKNYIKIVETNIKTASKDIIIKRNENKLIKPFGATDIFHIRPLEGYNKDLAKYFGIICEYSTEKTYDEAPKKKKQRENTGYGSESSIPPVLWGVIFVLGFGIVIWILASRGKAINIKKTKTGTKTQSAKEKISETVEQDSSFTRKIARLKKLYKNGTLTKAEFEKAKNKLLK